MKGEDGDLRRAVQPEGNSHRANAPIDVKLHILEVEKAFRVVFAHGWKDERAEKGQAYLAAVGMAGQHKIDKLPPGMLDDCVGVVGFVRHQQHGGVGQRWHGEFKARVGGSGVVDSAEPESRAVALDGHMLVDQDRDAICGERADDERSADGDIVVAKAGVAQRASEGAEDLGTTMGRVVAGKKSERSMGHEVSGKENHVRAEGVDMIDNAFQKRGLRELVEMDVADLSDAEAVEGAGEIGEGDRAGDEIDLVAGDLAGIKG